MQDSPVRDRYFTPAEAQALLPGLRAKLRAIDAHIEDGRDCRALLDEVQVADRRRVLLARLEELRQRIERLMAEIQAEGVEVKGLSPALLDFPALLYGREVYLCWREGEDTLAWWHPVNTGFADRRPLDALGGDAWEWLN